MKVSAINLDRFNQLQAKKDVSFRGNEVFDKKPYQTLSIAPEHKGIGLKTYNEGGLACVAYEAPQSWKADLNADVRTVLPYHAPNNPKGMMKLATLPKDGSIPAAIDITQVRDVSPDYVPQKNESFVLLNSVAEAKKDGEIATKYKFIRLEPTDVKGSITSLKEAELATEQIPYRFFKQVDAPDEMKYFVHTPQVAAMPKCYGIGATYQSGQTIGDWWDLYYSNFNRAVADSMPQLAEKEGFNPANVWMHDRPAFAFQHEVAKRSSDGKSFYDGLRMHSTLHNPGHDYQGYFDNPLGFLRIAFDEKDFQKLKDSPEFYELKAISKKGEKNLTQAEITRRDAILKKYFEHLLDDNGKPNITMMTVANTRLNPANATVGTVSKNYGKEMKLHTGIAEGMTKALSSIRTIDVTNGNTPASMGLDAITNIGQAGNGLTERKAEYTRYSPVLSADGKIMNYTDEEKQAFDLAKERAARTTNEESLKLKSADLDAKKQELETLKKSLAEVSATEKAEKEAAIKKLSDETKALQKEVTGLKKAQARATSLFDLPSVKDAKAKNKEWLLDLIGSCVDKNGKPDEAALNKLFFTPDQINKSKMKVHGFISKYTKGDKVFTSWGRSDMQKGFSTLLQGFYKFLSNPNIAEEEKSHAKLLFGSAGTWPKDHGEYKIIQENIEKISKLNGGKYAGNVCYVEGFFPNKLVACADWGIFTSRYEPCGITPLETFASGNPTLSIRTGGAPDFIKDIGEAPIEEANGIMTKHAFMLDDEEVKKLTAVKYQTLDEGRREVLSDEVSTLFEKAMKVDEKTYDKMAKNACQQRIEWINNAAYNGGRTANNIYMEDVFLLREKTLDFAEPRTRVPLKKLTSTFGDTSSVKVEIAENPVDTVIKKVAKEAQETVTSKSGFLKKLLKDKRTLVFTGSLAVVAGIAAYAINRDKMDSDITASKVGNSKVYFA